MGLKGAILGDIAGSKWEFCNSVGANACRKSLEYALFDIRNFFTDDTVMSIATANAIHNRTMDFAKEYRKMGQKYPDLSYGCRFADWLFDSNLGAYYSFGNGSAMRVGYIGDKYPLVSGPLGHTVDEIAAESAMVTHNHPEGLKGAIVTAHCIAMAKAGKTKEDIYKYALTKYRTDMGYKYGVDKSIDMYKNTISFAETCQDSVPVAIRCFYETNSFMECMYLINSMHIDTDTIGAIAGSICETFYGHCMGSIEEDNALLKRYLDDYLYQNLIDLGVIEEKTINKEEPDIDR